MTADDPTPTEGTTTWNRRVDAGLAGLSISGDDRGVTVTIDGELDVSNVSTVQSAVVAAMRGGARELVLDLTAVTYVDSSTIAMVVTFASEMTMKRGRLTLVAPSHGQVRRVLHYAGVADQLELHESLASTARTPSVPADDARAS
jgi:anti-sigma B factor antagonist